MRKRDAASSPQEPKLLPTLGRDIRDVVVAVQRAGLKKTIRRGVSDLQSFYLSTHRQTRLATMGRVRRWLLLSGWLLRSLFLKLTPTRRVLLLIAFLLLWRGSTVDIRQEHLRVVFNFGLLGVVMLLVILMLELKDKLLARNELEAGRTVQLALMPDRSPVLAGWDIWLYTRSANDVGGDLVDYLQIDPQRLGVMLGDVAGKGLPAALLMAKLQATLRALVSGAASLGALGAEVNRILAPRRVAQSVRNPRLPGNRARFRSCAPAERRPHATVAGKGRRPRGTADGLDRARHRAGG